MSEPRLTLIQEQVLYALARVTETSISLPSPVHPERVREKLRERRPRVQSVAYVRRILRDLVEGYDPPLAREQHIGSGARGFVPTAAGFERAAETEARYEAMQARAEARRKARPG